MFKYLKHTNYPVNIKKKDLKMAKYLITQFGGANGELAAAMRYFSQKFSMPDDYGKALLNDIATEELGHCEMIASMVHQLTKNASIEEIEAAGLSAYYTDHGVDVYPQSAAGVPFSANCLACKGDPIANLQEDLAAEQKARATYEKVIDLCRDNPDVVEPLKFLREREVVHFQRFGEALRGVQDKLADKKFYMNECK